MIEDVPVEEAPVADAPVADSVEETAELAAPPAVAAPAPSDGGAQRRRAPRSADRTDSRFAAPPTAAAAAPEPSEPALDATAVINADDLDDGAWEPVESAAAAPTPMVPTEGPVVASSPVVATGSPMAPSSGPAPATPAAPPASRTAGNVLPSWTGYRPVGARPAPTPDATAEPELVSAAVSTEPVDAANAVEQTMLSESTGVGPFDGGAYLTPPNPEPNEEWRTDEEELSLAGTAAAAEMVAAETSWDDDSDEVDEDRWAGDDPVADQIHPVEDDSRVDYRQISDPRTTDPSGVVTAAPTSSTAADTVLASLPKGLLAGTGTWANLVTTSGLCLSVVAGLWQLIALASGVSSRAVDGTDVLHKVGAGLGRTGPAHGLMLLVAVLLVALPSFLGDRNAHRLDDAAGTALGICAASAILGAVGAVMTFRFGIHAADISGQVTAPIALSSLSDLIGTAGASLTAFATSLMALRTRR